MSKAQMELSAWREISPSGTVRKMTESKDVVHRQNAGAGVTGIGDPADRLGAQELEALSTIEFIESSAKLSGRQECVLAGRPLSG
jgi:hypothetical protein